MAVFGRCESDADVTKGNGVTFQEFGCIHCWGVTIYVIKEEQQNRGSVLKKFLSHNLSQRDHKQGNFEE